ncbi:hypothetical protein [Rosenbergiella australiborealis]|uniref:hypothetical protein n=1 Tax=Rosenbergiella australiborealis TaxID=1544696 RepID=UPI001F4E7356|nr:hypothetical protein [Rosenbergiella australiborealis]
MFTDGPDAGVSGIAVGSTGLAWTFSEYAPRVVNSLTGKEVPGFVFEAIGSLGTEFLGGYSKDFLNAPVPQNPPEKTKEIEK